MPIPIFPEFKHIELADRRSVEKLTEKFPTYSDFHFSSLYSWDIHSTMRLSTLHGNLVVLFGDYITGNFFLTFIGQTKIAETAMILLDYAQKNNYEPCLKLIPEEMMLALSVAGFAVEPDADNHDYLYAIDHLAEMDRWTHGRQRRQIKKFITANPQYVAEIKPLREIHKETYLEFFRKWADSKHVADHTELNEFKAFIKLLHENDGRVEMLSLYHDSSRAHMIGCTSFELAPAEYAIAHFSKADTNHHAAIYCVLIWEEAKYLKSKGAKHYNWEQDLGIPGLRSFKLSYRPEFFLKKYTVRLPTSCRQ